MLQTRPVTAIVVEDEPVTREIARTVLEPLGCVVVGETDSGEEAIRLYSETDPDLTLLDINLTGQSWLETLTQLRAVHPDAYVVMMTGVMDADTVEDCIRAGAKDFLKKSTVWESIGPRLRRQVDRMRCAAG